MQCQICNKYSHDASTRWHRYTDSRGGTQANPAPPAQNQNQLATSVPQWSSAPAALNHGPGAWFDPTTFNHRLGSWFGPNQSAGPSTTQ